jgi:hypothetical protein
MSHTDMSVPILIPVNILHFFFISQHIIVKTFAYLNTETSIKN